MITILPFKPQGLVYEDPAIFEGIVPNAILSPVNALT